MDRLSLNAQERTILGKKVKKLRRDGFIPGHVFGKKVDTEHVSVPVKEFLDIAEQAGETGLIDLKIGAEKIRPVLIRELSHDPMSGQILNVSFYQVNLTEKVTVPVPIILKGEEAESVHMGEAVVLQNLSEVSVEALPTDLIENIEVDITPLKNIGDAITVADLNYDREKITVLAEAEEVVVKLDTAVTEEMKKLLEEQEAEAAAAVEAAEGVEGEGEASAEGEQVEGEGVTEGETPESDETPTAEGGETEEKAAE